MALARSTDHAGIATVDGHARERASKGFAIDARAIARRARRGEAAGTTRATDGRHTDRGRGTSRANQRHAINELRRSASAIAWRAILALTLESTQGGKHEEHDERLAHDVERSRGRAAADGDSWRVGPAAERFERAAAGVDPGRPRVDDEAEDRSASASELGAAAPGRLTALTPNADPYAGLEHAHHELDPAGAARFDRAAAQPDLRRAHFDAAPVAAHRRASAADDRAAQRDARRHAGFDG